MARTAITSALCAMALACTTASLGSLPAEAETPAGAARLREPQSTPMAQTPRAGRPASYVVNLRGASRADRLAGHRAVSAAKGRVVQAWPEIGVLVVQSADTSFARSVSRAKVVVSVGATRSVPVRPTPRSVAPVIAAGTRAGREVTRWNMSMIGADRAHRVTRGSSAVTVAVVDSGIDPTHPDLRHAVDARRSVGCTAGGRPDTRLSAWRATTNPHGTHVAGIIGAARNGRGTVGVAPGVRLTSVKVVDEYGMIYPEYAICGVMSTARTGAEIANHSYFVDPFVFWCDDQSGQRAVKESLRRALAWSRSKGVVNVAAAGNSGLDLTRKSVDSESPTDGRLRMRRINSTCHDIPTELPGVVSVSAVDRTRSLAPYSNEGLGVVDVAAPGDEIVSTVTGGRYREESGTSMAAPHVSGVLALLRSTHPHANHDQLVSMLTARARRLPCPPRDPFCRARGRINSYYGHGLVDAAAAVRR